MNRFALCCLLALIGDSAIAFETGPAPAGNAATVAQKIILDNFEKKDCPLITSATRGADGSIKASCSNGESFWVFSLRDHGNIAMRCSAFEKMGMERPC